MTEKIEEIRRRKMEELRSREGAEAADEAEREPPERVGPVGLARGLQDPDVQHGFGYLLALAGGLGRKRAEDGER